MPRRKYRSPWPLRFMVLAGLTIVILGVIAFSALKANNLGLAFSMFVGIVVMLIFEIVLLIIHNRQAT